MRRKLINFGIVISSVFTLGTLVLPKIAAEPVFATEIAYTDISTESDLRDMTLNGNYRLAGNITLTSGWTPVGTSLAPFTGIFDGNGYTISNLNLSGDSQGFFGYTSGAEIKNLKISGVSYDFTETPSESEYFAGAIAGYASNGSVISNCEIDGIESNVRYKVDEEIGYKLTFGGVVGWLSGVATIDGVSVASKIANVAVYDDFLFSENLKNDYTVKIGGIVGSINGGAIIENVASFSEIEINDLTASDIGTTYVGQIAGETSGNETRIFNSISDGEIRISVNGQKHVGSVIGGLNLIPQSGNISNIAYSQLINPIGEAKTYVVKNSSTNDYVANLPKTSFSDQRLYFDEEYIYNPTENQEKTFLWYDLSKGWESNVWCMNIMSASKSEVRLQRFQIFSITISTQLDNQNLLELPQNPTTKTDYYYSEVAEFAINLKSGNAGFYEVEKIYVNGNQINYQILESESEKPEEDVGLYKSSTGYVLKVVSKSYTSGSYSFELKANSFEGRVYVDGDVGGSIVRFAGSTNKRTFTKSSTATSAEARAGSMYIFKNWNLYYKTTASEAVENDNLKDGFLEVDSVYWKKVGPVYATYDNESNFKYATSSLGFKFGENLTTFVIVDGERNLKYLDRDFLLEAIFEEDPYKITFSKTNDYAVKKIEKVLVNNVDISTTNNFAIVGKSDVVVIDVYVETGYELSLETILNSIRNDKLQPSVTTRDSEYKDGTIYTIEFNTNKLDSSKMDPNEHNKFSFVLAVNEKIIKKETPNLLWIIIGSSVGGVILIIIVIWLIIRFAGGRGGSSGGSISKSEKPSKSSVNTDYKKYYM